MAATLLVAACGAKSETTGAGAVTQPGTPTVTAPAPAPKPTASPAASPTPSPTASASGQGDFCAQYRAMAKWSFANQAKPTPEAWAAQMVRRLTAMRPAAPADKRAWVDSLLRVFRLVAASAGPAVIGNEVATGKFPAAGRGLALYCKVDPALLRVN